MVAGTFRRLIVGYLDSYMVGCLSGIPFIRVQNLPGNAGSRSLNFDSVEPADIAFDDAPPLLLPEKVQIRYTYPGLWARVLGPDSFSRQVSGLSYGSNSSSLQGRDIPLARCICWVQPTD